VEEGDDQVGRTQLSVPFSQRAFHRVFNQKQHQAKYEERDRFCRMHFITA